MSKNKLKIVLIALIVMTGILFCGCSAKQDSAEGRALCESFLDKIIANDHAAAYEMVDDVCGAEEFDFLWDIMRDTFKNSSSYELEAREWSKNVSNGVTSVKTVFEVTTNDGKICQAELITADGVEGIAGFYFLDSTEFVESSGYVSTVNILLLIVSLLGFAFSIWMLVDCVKRPLKNKALWIFIIFIGAGFSITMGAQNVGFLMRFSLFIAMSSIVADRTILAITLNILLPVGAIIYFIVRKRITLSSEPTALSNDSTADVHSSENITDNESVSNGNEEDRDSQNTEGNEV